MLDKSGIEEDTDLGDIAKAQSEICYQTSLRGTLGKDFPELSKHKLDKPGSRN
jgi:hypothetical protein